MMSKVIRINEQINSDIYDADTHAKSDLSFTLSQTTFNYSGIS